MFPVELGSGFCAMLLVSLLSNNVFIELAFALGHSHSGTEKGLSQTIVTKYTIV